MNDLIEFDQQLLLALNGSDSVFWDGFWLCLTSPLTWIGLYFAILVLFVRSMEVQKLVLTVVLVALLILLADQGASGFCKPYFHRFRPTHEPVLEGLVDIVDGKRGGLYGFFSSHAANSFALCTFVSLIVRYRWVTCTMILYAFFTSFSRIYLGLHYPGDILCGALYGVFCGVLMYLIFCYLRSRLSTERKYYSNTYTQTGVLKDDASIVPMLFFSTLIYALFRGLFYSI